jgi:hypothetical protein
LFILFVINAYFHCFEQVLIFNKRLQRSVASHYCGQSGGTGGHYSSEQNNSKLLSNNKIIKYTTVIDITKSQINRGSFLKIEKTPFGMTSR